MPTVVPTAWRCCVNPAFTPFSNTLLIPRKESTQIRSWGFITSWTSTFPSARCLRFVLHGVFHRRLRWTRCLRTTKNRSPRIRTMISESPMPAPSTPIWPSTISCAVAGTPMTEQPRGWSFVRRCQLRVRKSRLTPMSTRCSDAGWLRGQRTDAPLAANQSPTNAFASISTSIAGSRSARTSTMAVAGRTAPRISPCALPTAVDERSQSRKSR